MTENLSPFDWSRDTVSPEETAFDDGGKSGSLMRASSGEAQGISGTGLGLYLCRELVVQHSGQIWFESREGAGSTFFVRLSLMPDQVGPTSPLML